MKLIVQFHEFIFLNGLTQQPWDYLDTETGFLVKPNLTERTSGNLEFHYNIDVSSDRYIQIPTACPYIISEYFKQKNWDMQELNKFGFHEALRIDKFMYYRRREAYTYGRFIGAAIALMENRKMKFEFMEYSSKRKYELSREWLQSKGIEIIE